MAGTDAKRRRVLEALPIPLSWTLTFIAVTLSIVFAILLTFRTAGNALTSGVSYDNVDPGVLSGCPGDGSTIAYDLTVERSTRLEVTVSYAPVVGDSEPAKGDWGRQTGSVFRGFFHYPEPGRYRVVVNYTMPDYLEPGVYRRSVISGSGSDTSGYLNTIEVLDCGEGAEE